MEGNWFLCSPIIPAELGDAGSWEEEAGVFHVPGGRGPGVPSSPHLAPGHPTLAWSREAALSLHRQGACRGRELAEERTRDRPPACGSQTLPRDPDLRPHVAPPRKAPLLEHIMCNKSCSRFSRPRQHSSHSRECAHKGPSSPLETAVHTAQRRLQRYGGGPLTGSPLGPEIPAQLTPDQPGSRRASRS